MLNMSNVCLDTLLNLSTNGTVVLGKLPEAYAIFDPIVDVMPVIPVTPVTPVTPTLDPVAPVLPVAPPPLPGVKMTRLVPFQYFATFSVRLYQSLASVITVGSEMSGSRTKFSAWFRLKLKSDSKGRPGIHSP